METRSQTPDRPPEPVRYMERTRDYYRALGYTSDYRWAHFDDVPLMRLDKPLAECTVTLITTGRQPVAATPSGMREPPEPPPRVVTSFSSASPPVTLFTADLAWDKEATHTEDLDSYFPIHRLQEAAQRGRIGSVAERCHSAPTEYSQRKTRTEDAPEIYRRCREDRVDAALLVPL